MEVEFMVWKRGLSLGLALALGGSAIQAQEPIAAPPGAAPAPMMASPAPSMPSSSVVDGAMPHGPAHEDGGAAEAPPKDEPKKDDDGGYGPTPFLKVGILQNLICGDKETPYQIGAWIESDYNYRSTGTGINNVAPVMNRFGDEFEGRQFGLYLARNLSKTDWDWGFNIIALAGADASFLNPTPGWYHDNNPRFGFNFTDANLTLHMPVLTDGGIDVKAGRQTTILGPMGALAWQRPFGSSDYAWYNLEEGRYTGVSAIWHVTKQLNIYGGCEVGGWGVWFDIPNNDMCGIAHADYWLDEDCKKVQVWTTCLCGNTGHVIDGNSTVSELGILINYSDQFYQIIDNQNCWSKAPVFGGAKPYTERAYDCYTYVGYRLTKEFDVIGRVEWYRDQDGLGYPGGFGNGTATTYTAETLGVNYHPNKWLEFRPEIRYDHADQPNFGAQNDKKNQLDCLANVLLKF